MKPVLYLSTAACFLAAHLLSVGLGPVRLSLYRLCLLAALGLLGYFMLGGKSEARVSLGRKNTLPVAFMALWLGWALLSLAWVKSVALWTKAVYFLGTGVLWTFCYSLFFTTQRDFRRVFWLMQGMMLFVGAIGWYEVATKDYRFIPMTPENIHAFVDAPARVPIALSGNPNDFALLCLFAIFVSYACWRGSSRLAAKLISAVGMVSAAGLLFFSESRANLLGLILALGVFVFLVFQKKRRALLLLLLAGAGLAVFAATPYWGMLWGKLGQVLRFNFHSEGFNSESVRVNLILNGLYFLAKTFWIGTGAGNIEYWMAHDTFVTTAGYVNIHNWWVELLASYGLVFFLCYLVFYGWLALRLYRMYRRARDPFLQGASLGLLCCMAGFVIGSISSSSNMKTEWLWVFWAVLIAFTGLEEAPAQSGSQLPEEGKPGSHHKMD